MNEFPLVSGVRQHVRALRTRDGGIESSDRTNSIFTWISWIAWCGPNVFTRITITTCAMLLSRLLILNTVRYHSFTKKRKNNIITYKVSRGIIDISTRGESWCSKMKRLIRLSWIHLNEPINKPCITPLKHSLDILIVY